jgi:hypothetical protein
LNQAASSRDEIDAPHGGVVSARFRRAAGARTGMFQTDILSLPEYRVLDVNVRRSGSRFKWQICESDGRVIATSADTYSTDREAVRAGYRAARAIRDRCKSRPTRDRAPRRGF